MLQCYVLMCAGSLTAFWRPIEVSARGKGPARPNQRPALMHGTHCTCHVCLTVLSCRSCTGPTHGDRKTKLDQSKHNHRPDTHTLIPLASQHRPMSRRRHVAQLLGLLIMQNVAGRFWRWLSQRADRIIILKFKQNRKLERKIIFEHKS
jgi:hypothetical protein